MRLEFEGKKKPIEILKSAGEIDCLTSFDGKKSYVFFGDNFNGMSRLLSVKKEFVDLVYIDPPFNTNQIFSVGEDRISTISRKKSDVIAYSDLMGYDDFINFMYERFVLIHELLSDKGSLYVHIDTKMGHYFKIVLDEVFGKKCFKNDITRIKSNPKNFDRKAYGNQKDMILFYTKNPNNNIWNEIRTSLNEDEIKRNFTKIDADGRRYTTIPLHAPGECNGVTGGPWRDMLPPEGRHWRTNPEEFEKMDKAGLIEWSANGNPRIKKYADEHKGKKIQDIWTFKDPQYPVYPTQKNQEMLELIIKQSSNVGSYVMDCFSGSGATILAAAQNDRRFIGMDNSSLSIETIRNQLNGIDYIYEEESQKALNLIS